MAGDGLTGLRVLAVQDGALLSMPIGDDLEELGCDVAGAGSRLGDAMEKARTLALGTAVLDVNLAGRLS